MWQQEHLSADLQESSLIKNKTEQKHTHRPTRNKNTPKQNKNTKENQQLITLRLLIIWTK